MSKKKAAKLSSTRGAQAKRRARRRRNPDSSAAIVTSSASNPPLFRDLLEFAAPGFAGYAGTRLIQRVLYTQLSKRWPRAARHLAAGSGAMAFLAAWFLLHRWKKLEKYHTPATVGAFIAAAQTIVQTYLPKFGWMVSDFQPTVGSVTAPSLVAAAAPVAQPIDDDDDDDELVNPFDSTLGSLSGSTIGHVPSGITMPRPAPAPTMSPMAPIDDDGGDLDDFDDDYIN